MKASTMKAAMRALILALATGVLGIGAAGVQAAERDEQGSLRQDKRDDGHGRSGRDRDEDRDREREKDRDDDRDRAKVQVSLTAPTTGTIYSAPATVVLSAAAQSSQKNHPVTRVEFYQGATLIGTATAAPYRVTWSATPAGRYRLTAKAYSDKAEQRERNDKDEKAKDVAVSAPVDIVVNALPTVILTSPTANQVVTAPATLTLSANAADADGSIAKVDFFNGPTLVGTVTSAPYAVSLTGLAAGTYSLTAKVTDNLGGTATSTPVTVIVNGLPTVSLISPTANTILAAPTSITVTASATDADGTIAKVDFYQGTTLIGTATAAPYTVTWSNVLSGSYSLTATATDNLGGQVTSAPIAITVDAPPVVTLTSPSAGAVGIAPASFTLTANATDSDGTIAKVEFYQGATLIGTATSAPYTLSWNAVSPGNYSLTAVATDNLGLQTTSSPINVSVIANSPPAVSLTSPTPNQSFKAPATITLTASASDPDNNLAKVEFFQNGSLVATVLTAPYTTSWSNVVQGSYQITAIATDAVGAQTSSAPIAITVTPAQASLYFIHADHLGTPRLVTDESNTIVWRHLPTTEPFGNTPPEDDPNATGTRFEMPLAFPGQYRDRESGLSYNFFRDYDPGTGRYRQSDPIGLSGGINPYQYALSNPLRYIDPDGLDVTVSLNGSAAAGAGHVGIGVNSPNTVGQRPQPGQSGVAMALGQNVPGQISPDPAPDARVVIPTTPRQDQQVQQCIDQRTQQQQNYNLYQNNCAQFVEQCLGAAGVPVPDTRYPRTLFNDLQRRYSGGR